MRTFKRLRRHRTPWSFKKLKSPIGKSWKPESPLVSKGYRPLQLSFDDQLNALIYFHLEEFSSGRELLQALEQNNFAKECVAPPSGIKKSAFFEAINTRGLDQLKEVFNALVKEAQGVIPTKYQHLGNLVSIDGSLIDSVFSMDWADYSTTQKKAKVHVGFDINRGIPKSVFLTDGKHVERPFVDQIIGKGETAVMDRGYQCNKDFDQWQNDEKLFVCRIQQRTTRTVIRMHDVPTDSIVFYDAIVRLGSRGSTLAEKDVRLVGYKVDHKDFWVATNRHDLSAEQVAEVYKLRWNIETFFGWWKRHLKVYHLIARSEYGLMVQILGGLITYLLLAIYCRQQHNEPVSINRVRELRNKIANEAAEMQKRRNQRTGQSYKVKVLRRKPTSAKT
jgi:hypothetical protein